MENLPAPRRRNTASRRKIMDAAIRLFTENGYMETTTLAIAREAGVNEATIFRNFGSKKDLFQEIFWANTLSGESLAPQTLSDGEDLRGDLRQLFRAFLSACVKHIPNYRLSVQQIDEVFDREFYHAAVDHIDTMASEMVAYLERLRGLGRIADIDCAALSEYLFSVFLVKAPQLLMEETDALPMDEILDRESARYADFVCALAAPRTGEEETA